MNNKPLTITRIKRSLAKKWIDQGYVAVVVSQYGTINRPDGSVISRHRSYAAAEKSAKGNTFAAIWYLDSI